MKSFWRAVKARPAAIAVALLMSSPAFAQTNQAQLHVTVVDQTGAGIPAATVRVTPAEGAATELSTDEHGQLTIPDISPQSVTIHAEFPGFEPFDGTVTLRRGTNNQVVTLAIAGVQEEVVVAESGTDDTQGNAMTTVLEEDDIAQLSDDPDELQAQLEAMTGGAGAVFSVDGFRGGRLPNRDEIRQIRFRNNSFSADNHDAGRMQVEIITKPGMAAWNGNANMGLRSDVLNARNAFAGTQTPEQFRRFSTGLRGPLVKGKTSLRINVDGNRSFDSGTIVALTPDGRIGDQVKRPFDSTNVTVGLEHALSANQTFRFEYRNSQDERRNLGVGDFSLADRAYTRSNDEHQLRASVQSVLGKTSLNQFRVQLNRQSTASTSASSAPTIVVIDAFTNGGAGVANQGTTHSLMVSDDLDFTVGKHAMRAGLLLNGDRFNNMDNRNAAGTFTFGSLAAFLAGTPDTFTQRLGQVRTQFSQYELGLYWQDEVRLNRSLSVSYGVREEVQSHVADAFNLMPRFGFTFNPNRSKTTTIRGGYGMFTDWYDASLYDQTLRVNGVAQRDLLVLNPGFPDPIGGVTATVLPGGRIQADPDLKLPYIHQMSIGLERKLSANLNVQTSFTRLDGRNQLRSVNVNAPNEFGIRPEPTIGTITQIESTGRSLTNRLNVNATYRVPARRTFINVGYTLASAKNMADNPLSLPANSFNPDAEWGPSSQDIRHRLNSMVNFSLPSDFRVGIGANVQSGAPYTITTGRDTNGDGVVNDRPEGVGRNSERGDARWDMSARITKSVTFGGVRAGTPQRGRAGDQVGPAGPRQGQGGGPGGGRGGDALGNAANQRFTVEFYAQAFNLLNHTNFVNYSGNLLSPFFGLPTSAAQARRLEVGLQFRF